MLQRFTIKVIPRSSQDQVIGQDVDLFGNKILKIKTSALPENNQANKAVIKILSKYFKVAKSNIRVVSGHTKTTKVIEIDV